MRRRNAALLLSVALVLSSLTGCGTASSAEDTATVTEESTEAAETTTEDTAEADTEASEADATEEEAEVEVSEDFIPDDFVQERAGVNTFASYDEIISYLTAGTEGYAYITVDGSDKDLLVISDFLYQWDDDTMAAMSVSFYGYNTEGQIMNLGSYTSGGTGYPLYCANGILYLIDRYQYGEMKVSPETGGLYYTKSVSVEYAEDGTASFSGFEHTDDDIFGETVDTTITTEDEFFALFTPLNDLSPVNFQVAE